MNDEMKIPNNEAKIPGGVLRAVDDLGRIVLPKEMRKEMGVETGQPMVISRTETGFRVDIFPTVEHTVRQAELLDNNLAALENTGSKNLRPILKRARAEMVHLKNILDDLAKAANK